VHNNDEVVLMSEKELTFIYRCDKKKFPPSSYEKEMEVGGFFGIA